MNNIYGTSNKIETIFNRRSELPGQVCDVEISLNFKESYPREISFCRSTRALLINKSFSPRKCLLALQLRVAQLVQYNGLNCRKLVNYRHTVDGLVFEQRP